MAIPFAKVEAIGNDFVLIESGAVPVALEATLAREVSSRHFGIGADGLLVVGRTESGLVLRMYNADGSEDFCGNGLRLAAWYARAHGWISETTDIDHHGRSVMALVEGPDVTVELPPASYVPSDIPMLEPEPWVERSLHGVRGTAVSTGSAHFVAFVKHLPGDRVFEESSRLIENDRRFPERISVMWAQQVGEARFALRIWERGVGETMGCGTGSLAVAAVAHDHLGVPSVLDIDNPGGRLRVAIGSDRRLRATSTARIVYRGEFKPSPAVSLHTAGQSSGLPR